MQIGLEYNEIMKILESVKMLEGIEKLYLFGSRAILNHKPSSDVDLCVKGTSLPSSLISHLRYILNEETNLPYFFDIVDYDSITSQELIKHIDELGVDLLAL